VLYKFTLYLLTYVTSYPNLLSMGGGRGGRPLRPCLDLPCPTLRTLYPADLWWGHWRLQ